MQPGPNAKKMITPVVARTDNWSNQLTYGLKTKLMVRIEKDMNSPIQDYVKSVFRPAESMYLTAIIVIMTLTIPKHVVASSGSDTPAW